MLKKIYILATLLFLIPPYARAQNIWKGTSCAPGGGGPTGPCSVCDSLIVTSNIITYLAQFAVLISVAMMVYGAILMMVSGGDEGKFKDGKSKITNAIIGLVVVMLAWVIINTVLRLLTGGGADLPWNNITCSTS